MLKQFESGWDGKYSEVSLGWKLWADLFFKPGVDLKESARMRTPLKWAKGYVLHAQNI